MYNKLEGEKVKEQKPVRKHGLKQEAQVEMGRNTREAEPVRFRMDAAMGSKVGGQNKTVDFKLSNFSK